MKMNVASGSITPKNLSYSHYTTMGFSKLIPVGFYDVMPNEHMTIKPTVFARAAATKLPNLGTLDMSLHAFYCPYHTVWRHFDNFVARRKSWTYQGAQEYKYSPFTTSYLLTRMFIARNPSSGLTIDVNTADDCDFSLCDGETTNYYQLTKKGKFVYHLLSALGLKFNFCTDDDDPNGDLGDNYSLLPLMAYFKCFLDRYIPSQLQASSPINQFFEYVNELPANDIAQPLEYDRILYLFEYVYTYYQRNYFTSAWMYPNAPVSGLLPQDHFKVNQITMEQDSSSGDSIDRSDQYTRLAPVPNVTSLNISSDKLTLLSKVNRFFKRLAYTGSRPYEALKALFGVKGNELELGMSVYLGSYSVSLQKADVTVTGSEEEAGFYAGQAWFSSGENDKRTFNVKCDYHGAVFVLASILTPSTFVEGVRRVFNHIKPSDFYNPDFDGTLFQAIKGTELFSQLKYVNPTVCDDIAELGLNSTRSYGFVPRYAEYQQPLDNVSGDFDLDRYGLSIDGYILPRRLFDKEEIRSAVVNGNADDYSLSSTMYAGLQDVITPLDVIRTFDSSQFNRIFKEITGMVDPFVCIFRFDTLAFTPQIPLDETSEIKGRGKQMEFDKNGIYVD